MSSFVDVRLGTHKRVGGWARESRLYVYGYMTDGCCKRYI